MKGGKQKNEASSTLKKVEDKKIAKRKPASKEENQSKRQEKKGKGNKDPNRPKRPASAFFVFMEEFRKTYKEKNPNVKSVSVMGKAGGDKWKSLSDAEKAPYNAKAAKRKAEYEKTLAAYNNKSSNADDGEESDKSKSEINDDDDDGGSGEDEDQE